MDICTDSQSLVDSLESSKQIDSKLLRPIIKFMKQMLDGKMINIVGWINTEVCMADILTKPSQCALTAKVMDWEHDGSDLDIEKIKHFQRLILKRENILWDPTIVYL